MITPTLQVERRISILGQKPTGVMKAVLSDYFALWALLVIEINILYVVTTRLTQIGESIYFTLHKKVDVSCLTFNHNLDNSLQENYQCLNVNLCYEAVKAWKIQVFMHGTSHYFIWL